MGCQSKSIFNGTTMIQTHTLDNCPKKWKTKQKVSVSSEQVSMGFSSNANAEDRKVQPNKSDQIENPTDWLESDCINGIIPIWPHA